MSVTARKLTFGSALRVTNLVAAAVVSFLMMPFVVHTLGDKLYGLWTLVATFINYYGIMDLGLSTAVTRHLSRALGAEDLEECNQVFNTALLVYLCIGVLVLAAGAVLAAVGPAFTKNPHDAQLLSKLLLITSFTAALGFPVRVFVGVLNSHLRYDRTAALELLTLLLRSGLMVAVLLIGHGILGLAWASLLGSLPGMGLYAYFSFQDLPFLRLDPRYRSRKMVRTLFGYSSFSFIAQLADVLRFQVDALVVAAFVGVAAVTHYRIAGTMTQYFIEFMLAVMGVFHTVFSRQEGGRDFAALQRTFLFASKLSVAVSTFVGFGLLAWGKAFITRWMGPSYLNAYPCLIVLVAGCLTAQWQAPSVSLLYGISRHRFFALFNSVEGVANLVLSILLARRLGIVGVALGTAIPMILVKLLVQPIYTCRVAGVSYLRYMRQMGRTLAASSAALILPYFVTLRIIAPDYKVLVAIGAVSALLYAPTAWMLAFSPEERRMLWKKIQPQLALRETA